MKTTAAMTTERVVAGLPRGVAVFYLLLFCTALVIYGAAWRSSMATSADTPGYYAAAQDLADLHIDQLQDRSPGYPLFLLLNGASDHPTKRLFFTSLLLHLTTIWLLAVTLYSAGLDGTWLKVFGILLLLPPYVQSAATVLTENLTQFCLVCGFSGLVRWRLSRRPIHLIIASVAIAYGGLTRPTYQVLAPIVALFLLSAGWYQAGLTKYHAIKASAALILTSALMIGGFSAINYSRFGYFGITPLLGFNLSTRTVLFWDRLPDEHRVVKEILIKARDADLIEPGSSHTGYQSSHKARPEIIRVTGMTQAETARYLVRMNLELILLAPLNYLGEVGRVLGGSYWFPAANELANMNSRVVQMIWAAVHFIIIGFFFLTFVILCGTAAERIVRAVATGWPAPPFPPETHLQIFTYCLAGTMVFYTMIISCAVDTGTPRYRLPTDCLILLMTFLAPLLWRRAAGDLAPENGLER